MAGEDSDELRCVATDHRKSIQQNVLVDFKNALRQHLRVRAAFDTKRCIACAHAHTWSDAGRFEHHKTGLCETCWCVLAKPRSMEKNHEAVIVCDRLKDEQGCEFMYQWLTVTKCIEVDQVTEYAKFDADSILSIVSGTVALPDIWRPGCRPDP